MKWRSFAVAVVVIASACGGSDGSSDPSSAPPEPEVLVALPESRPGEIVGLVANDDDRSIEWVDRLDGTIRSLGVDDPDSGPVIVANVPVGSAGEQRGLLGQVVVDDRRFAAWTQPETFDLVVGELLGGDRDSTGVTSTRLIWSAGEAGSGAIGGVLDELDGRILVGVGRNTGFDRSSGVGGAMVTLDPDGSVDQEPDVVSVGYTNPWAFTVIDGREIWVADNAAGPDPEDETVDDIERIGRADLLDDRADMTRIVEAGRAPSAMIELPDGRIGICGFLDNELRAYEIVDGADADPANPATLVLERSELSRAGTIMPCLTGAAAFADGTIVTVALADTGLALHILRPA